MAILNSNQRLPFFPHLPLFGSLSTIEATTGQASHNYPESSFENKIHEQIINLQKNRAQLSIKLAKAREKPPTPAQKQELFQEFNLLEQTRKWLTMILQAIEKSRQDAAANLR